MSRVSQAQALRPDVKAMLAVKQSGDVDVRGVSVTMRGACEHSMPWDTACGRVRLTGMERGCALTVCHPCPLFAAPDDSGADFMCRCTQGFAPRGDCRGATHRRTCRAFLSRAALQISHLGTALTRTR